MSYIYSEATINDIKRYQVSESFKYVYYPKFIFLCGKAFEKADYATSNRGILQNYIAKRASSIYVILSEKSFDSKFLPEIDLLSFEEYIAEICDYIFLFVESMGTACELGAFTYINKQFNEKLIIINDNRHKGKTTFINNGPIDKAMRNGCKVIHADIENGPLLGSLELRSEIDRILIEIQERNIKNKRINNQDKEKVFLNSFIIEILEIIRLIQPVDKQTLVEVYKRVKGFDSFRFAKANGDKFEKEPRVQYILNLLLNMDLIECENNQYSMKIKNVKVSLMFSFSDNSLNITRNRILSRKYKYGEI